MWTMMGYSDSMPDSFNGRKLRPLVPRPLSNSANNNNPNTPTLPCLHATQLFSLNHHHLGSHFGEQNKREFNTAAPVVLSSSRWNPTPEQLRILEELYRRGTRTPSADQIQHITAQLRRYGKIEGKNVFYWFQNHKARERQKRRRQMESSASHDLNLNDVVENLQRNKASSGTNRTAYEVEQTKSIRAAPTNCSTLSEVRTTRKGCRCGCGLIQLDEPDLQRRDFVGRNATWQHMMMMHQVSCPKLKSSMENQQEVKMTKKNTLPPRHHHPQELNIFITPYSSYTKQNDAAFTVELQEEEEEEEEDYSYSGESHDQTLELFPLRSGDAFHNSFDKITVDPHYQFFEFLPLKE